MNEKNLLKEIEKTLNTLQNKTSELLEANSAMHLIDVDVLKNKTRLLYEQLHLLEQSARFSDASINLPDKMPAAIIPEKLTQEEDTEEQIRTAETKTEEAAGETPLQDKTPEQEPVREKTEKSKKEILDQEPEKTPEVKSEKTQPAPKKEERQAEMAEAGYDVAINKATPAEKVQSTIDLFSDESGESIGDVLGGADKTSIAEKMQKEKVNDLRKAIGINEKFLFINELFNGDMSRYNKVIDEIDELTTRQGVQTYLTELKIANQWPEDNGAFLAFKELLDRKFG